MAHVSNNLRRALFDNYGDARHARDAANILSFPPASPRDGSATAIDLIYQAAEMFTGIEHRARDIEANARAMCQNAVDKLVDSEQRIQASERARRDIIANVDRRLQEVSLALSDAKARIDAAEARANAAERRATAAEAEAETARRLLAQVEDTIRSRLLGEDAGIHPLRRMRA